MSKQKKNKRIKRCQNGNRYAGLCFCDDCISPRGEGIERINAKDNNGTTRVVKDLSKSKKKEWD